jgi:transposase
LTVAVFGLLAVRRLRATRSWGPGSVLVELSVVEQRYRAVLALLAGESVTAVAAQTGVSRQSLHKWLARYRQDGLGGLIDRSRRPESSPWQSPPEVEAVVCEMRREHPRWGPRRLAHELGRGGMEPVPSRMTVYRILVRHGLVEPRKRGRRREDYKRWERDAPMALWQLDIVGGVFLADGREVKVVTGVDDHSRPQGLRLLVYSMRYDQASAHFAEFGPFVTGVVGPLRRGARRRRRALTAPPGVSPRRPARATAAPSPRPRADRTGTSRTPSRTPRRRRSARCGSSRPRTPPAG